MLRTILITTASAGVMAVAGLTTIQPAQALTMQECSVKYRAAQRANTLKGMKWNDFRKAECSDEDASDNEASAAVPAEAAQPATPAAAPAKPASTRRIGAPVFPRAVAQKYSSETPGKARLKTCADQYNANKARGGNGDLKWIQQGGGYWSQCNLKS
jgi:hypothetical protein